MTRVTWALIAITVFVPAMRADIVGSVYDVFPGSSCSNASCDVIGLNSDFDVAQVNLDLGAAGSSITILTNYDHPSPPYGVWSLGPWMDWTLEMRAGDLFLDFSPGLTYAIPLYDHPGSGASGASTTFVHGGLYEVSGSVSTRTASDVLGIHSWPASRYIFRDDAVVWLGGVAPQPLALATETVVLNGNGVTKPKFAVTFDFGPELWTAINPDPDAKVDVHFSSNTCGNDVIDGTAVPEPATGILLPIALAAVAMVGRRLGGRK